MFKVLSRVIAAIKITDVIVPSPAFFFFFFFKLKARVKIKKMKVRSLFARPHVVPIPYEFLSSAERKRRYFEERW